MKCLSSAVHFTRHTEYQGDGEQGEVFHFNLRNFRCTLRHTPQYPRWAARMAVRSSSSRSRRRMRYCLVVSFIGFSTAMLLSMWPNLGDYILKSLTP